MILKQICGVTFVEDSLELEHTILTSVDNASVSSQVVRGKNIFMCLWLVSHKRFIPTCRQMRKRCVLLERLLFLTNFSFPYF